MEIKILGTGCAKCKSLEKITRDMIIETGVDASVSKVDDIMDIMTYGVAATPALVIDGKVVLYGRIPSSNEMKKILTQ
ncbi:MAG: TM0996/MTH895 family glutaredoxin-like protein [Bacteroidales bacterium]|nr:TM0996/MTH895 family glutaredoxin-like protein [Bacteroidales bacterium]